MIYVALVVFACECKIFTHDDMARSLTCGRLASAVACNTTSTNQQQLECRGEYTYVVLSFATLTHSAN